MERSANDAPPLRISRAWPVVRTEERKYLWQFGSHPGPSFNRIPAREINVGHMPHVIVWDIETIPDISGFAAANDLFDKTAEEVRVAMGDKFPKHIYHSIICIGALIAHQDGDYWKVDALGAPHIGDRSEGELIAAFVDRIADLTPQLVTFNGSSFDLPVLRYRAMLHKVPAIGLSARPYFNRYTDDAMDLCDVLGSFSPQAKSTLHEICRVMGLPGKPDGIAGGECRKVFREGRI